VKAEKDKDDSRAVPWKSDDTEPHTSFWNSSVNDTRPNSNAPVRVGTCRIHFNSSSVDTLRNPTTFSEQINKRQQDAFAAHQSTRQYTPERQVAYNVHWCRKSILPRMRLSSSSAQQCRFVHYKTGKPLSVVECLKTNRH
jgi:hypothetical protein